ncbi:GGDEF domain-containing protein [Rhizobacter sp. J219]|uniref:GGDEF domain-containing protein n=1 Tax=Rhizobacter sp. J219 TaxID=2898430 RepID=UPI002151572D|nr:GGDEF domain-containing protein [Rhizobacter sp. J219]MCR5885881.1 GGDEF domain-containing protein [Rhizobacter sp. J219]
MSDLALGTTPPAAPKDSAAKPDRRFAHHLNNQRLILMSYLIDGVVLTAFHFAGTIGWLPVLAYTGAGVLITAVTYTLIASGWTQRFRDTGITIYQTIPAQALQLACMAFVPEVSFMFALLLFIVYCTLTLSLDVRRSIIAWAIAGAAAASVLAIVGTPLHIPSSNTAEQVISFTFFVITLWRCVLIGSFNRQMTSRLKARGRELAELTAKVDMLAHHDELTGVMNRRSLFAALRDEAAAGRTLQAAAERGHPRPRPLQGRQRPVRPPRRRQDAQDLREHLVAAHAQG